MPDHFKSLDPHADLQAICGVIREIINDLHHNENYSYDTISKKAANILAREPLRHTAIKNFLEQESTRVNANNTVLPVLYNYVRSDYQNLPPAIREKVLHYRHILIPDESERLSSFSAEKEIERSLGMMLKNWLKISDHEVNKLSAKMFGDFSGDYVLLRKSVVSADMIVKSRLKIDRANGRNVLPKIRHYHQDRHNVERVSTGVLLPMISNVYGVLEVENGEGLEFIALRNPIQWNFHKMMGFMSSMNMDRNILSARIFIEREGNIWDGIGHRFTREDIKGNQYIMSRVSLLDEGVALTIPDI